MQPHLEMALELMVVSPGGVGVRVLMVLNVQGGDSQVLHAVRGTVPALGVPCQQWDAGGLHREGNEPGATGWLFNLSSFKKLQSLQRKS